VRPLIRLLLLLVAALWLVFPGFGLIDLGVSWDRDWPVMLEGGWGLLCTAGLGVPTLLAVVRPRLARAIFLQLSVVGVALAVAVVLGREPQAWWFFVLLGVDLGLLWSLDHGPVDRAVPSFVLLALAVAAAPGWLAYAWWSLDQNRQSLPDGDISVGVDHYAIQGGLAIALVALPAVAGLVCRGRRLLGTSAAVMAGYLGAISLGWPDAVAGFDVGWSVLAVVWAVGVLVAAWVPRAVPVHP